jgi:hypothetical protein
MVVICTPSSRVKGGKEPVLRRASGLLGHAKELGQFWSSKTIITGVR